MFERKFFALARNVLKYAEKKTKYGSRILTGKFEKFD